MEWHTPDLSSLQLAGLGCFNVLLAFALAGVRARLDTANPPPAPKPVPNTPPLETW